MACCYHKKHRCFKHCPHYVPIYRWTTRAYLLFIISSKILLGKLGLMNLFSRSFKLHVACILTNDSSVIVDINTEKSKQFDWKQKNQIIRTYFKLDKTNSLHVEHAKSHFCRFRVYEVLQSSIHQSKFTNYKWRRIDRSNIYRCVLSSEIEMNSDSARTVSNIDQFDCCFSFHLWHECASCTCDNDPSQQYLTSMPLNASTIFSMEFNKIQCFSVFFDYYYFHSNDTTQYSHFVCCLGKRTDSLFCFISGLKGSLCANNILLK